MKTYRYLVNHSHPGEIEGRYENVTVSYSTEMPDAYQYALVTARAYGGTLYCEDEEGYRQVKSFSSRRPPEARETNSR